MKNKAVFLDRDGTINEQMGYINHVSRFIMLPNAAEAIYLLNKNEIPVFAVSNQSGLARGYFPESLIKDVHRKMEECPFSGCWRGGMSDLQIAAIAILGVVFLIIAGMPVAFSLSSGAY